MCLDNVNVSEQCIDVCTQCLDMSLCIWTCLHKSRQCSHDYDMFFLSKHNFGMPMVLSMEPLDLLGHNAQSEMQHDFFSLVMLMTSSMALFYSTVEVK